MKLFAYGTLLEPRVLERVIGGGRPGVAAELRGYRRFQFLNACYPGIVADPQGAVTGIVYRNIEDRDWIKLDEFEGEMYERIVITALGHGGSTIDAYTYVVAPQFRHHLSDHDWNFQRFCAVDLARYIDDV